MTSRPHPDDATAADPDPAGFVLAHLTDPHLTEPHPRLRDLLGKRALGFASWRGNRRHHHLRERLDRITADIRDQHVDHIAITGDLTQIGLAGERAAADAWLHALGPAAAVTVIPGNHDDYARRPGRPDGAWQAWMRSDAGPAGPADGWPLLRRRGPLTLIGLNSACPSGPLLATGTLGARQCAALAGMLEDARGTLRVVLVHHPPLPGRERWRKRLTDAAALRAVLARSGAELVLHGHTHRLRLESTDLGAGPLHVLSAPSASAASSGRERGAGWLRIAVRTAADHWQVDVTLRRVAAVGPLEAVHLATWALPRPAPRAAMIRSASA